MVEISVVGGLHLWGAYPAAYHPGALPNRRRNRGTDDPSEVGEDWHGQLQTDSSSYHHDSRRMRTCFYNSLHRPIL